MHSGTSPYLFYSEIDPPSQEEPQRSTVLVPDFCGNLFDTCVACLQEMYSAFNPQALKIRHWRFPEDALQAPSKRPFTCPDGSSCMVKRKATCESGTRPSFKVLYNGIGVDQVIRKCIGCLRGSGIDDEVFCCERGELRADATYQPKGE